MSYSGLQRRTTRYLAVFSFLVCTLVLAATAEAMICEADPDDEMSSPGEMSLLEMYTSKALEPRMTAGPQPSRKAKVCDARTQEGCHVDQPEGEPMPPRPLAQTRPDAATASHHWRAPGQPAPDQSTVDALACLLPGYNARLFRPPRSLLR